MRKKSVLQKLFVDSSIPTELFTNFYSSTMEIFSIYYKKDYIDWKKIMKIEEQQQWSSISQIDQSDLPILRDIEEGTRNMFVNSIRDEIALRAEITKGLTNDHREYLRLMTMGRMRVFEKIFNVTQEDKESFAKSDHKWWVAVGAVATLGAIGTIWLFEKSAAKKKK